MQVTRACAVVAAVQCMGGCAVVGCAVAVACPGQGVCCGCGMSRAGGVLWLWQDQCMDGCAVVVACPGSSPCAVVVAGPVHGLCCGCFSRFVDNSFGLSASFDREVTACLTHGRWCV